MRAFLLLSVVALSGCFTQAQKKLERHLEADKRCVLVTEESVKKLREPACRTDDKCYEANLEAIDSCAVAP